jgi:hypothetical protein
MTVNNGSPTYQFATYGDVKTIRFDHNNTKYSIKSGSTASVSTTTETSTEMILKVYGRSASSGAPGQYEGLLCHEGGRPLVLQVYLLHADPYTSGDKSCIGFAVRTNNPSLIFYKPTTYYITEDDLNHILINAKVNAGYVDYNIYVNGVSEDSGSLGSGSVTSMGSGVANTIAIGGQLSAASALCNDIEMAHFANWAVNLDPEEMFTSASGRKNDGILRGVGRGILTR